MSKGLAKWDPFRDLSDFQKRLADVFGGAGSPLGALEEADWHPAVDVSEDEEAFHIAADLPEVAKEDVHVKVTEGILTISGERKREKEEDDKKRKYHRVERSYGSYQRSFRIPEGIDPQQIKAGFKDGVLNVTIPKGKAPEPAEQRIEVK